MRKDLIQKFGIDSCPRRASDFFSRFKFSYTIDLNEDLPEIKQIMSIMVDYDVEDCKVVNTIEKTSEEMDKLLGKRLFVLVKIKFKILYIEDSFEEGIHVIEKETFNSTYISVPEKLQGTDVYSLIKLDLLSPKMYIEDIFLNIYSKKIIKINTFVYVELKSTSTYELCFSGQKSKKESCIFLSYGDGSNITCIVDDGNKNISPTWSPSGKKIAYLSNERKKQLIYIYDLTTQYIEQLINEWEVDSIRSFSWIDRSKIVFSGVIRGEQDLFIIDIFTKKVKKITYGNGLYKNCNPRISPEGDRILYDKVNTKLNVKELWSINSNGINSESILKNKTYAEVSWQGVGENIVYVLREKNFNDKIIIYSLKYDKSIEEVDTKGKIKKIVCSVNENYIAYIEETLKNDDIYILDLIKFDVYNITNNEENVRLGDLIWNIDGTEIYYTSHEVGNCNIYSVNIDNLRTKQLTNINALNINMTYRPRIV